MNTPVRVVLFYILTFIFTIFLGGTQQVLGIGNWIILPQLSPGLAALIMMALFRKDNVKPTISVKRAQTLKYIRAVGVPLFVSVVLFLIYRQFIGQLSIPSLSVISALILFVGMLIGAFGEELGWRGYLQPVLEVKANVLLSSLMVGVLWGVWHVGNYQYGAVCMSFFVLSTIAYSVIVAWLLRGTSYNVVIALLFHFVLNIGLFMLTNALTDLRFMMLNGILWVIVAAILVMLKREDFLPVR